MTVVFQENKTASFGLFAAALTRARDTTSSELSAAGVISFGSKVWKMRMRLYRTSNYDRT